jgi:hypothetical protein
VVDGPAEQALRRSFEQIGQLMLITTNPQQTLWETVLPPGYRQPARPFGQVRSLERAVGYQGRR